MILNDRIETTEAKAKAIKGELEKIVTKAAKQGEAARNTLRSRLVQEPLVDKMISEIGPRFANRPGGYTRIVRLGNRLKDNSEMVYLEWVEVSSQISEVRDQKKQKSEKKEDKKKDVNVEKPVKKAEKGTGPKPTVSKAKPAAMRRTGARGK
jgi:large subunit ribosomal protein L17